MNGWLSDREFIEQENAHRRRRLIRIVRGWLREPRHPARAGFMVWLAPVIIGPASAAFIEFSRGPVPAWVMAPYS